MPHTPERLAAIRRYADSLPPEREPRILAYRLATDRRAHHLAYGFAVDYQPPIQAAGRALMIDASDLPGNADRFRKATFAVDSGAELTLYYVAGWQRATDSDGWPNRGPVPEIPGATAALWLHRFPVGERFDTWYHSGRLYHLKARPVPIGDLATVRQPDSFKLSDPF